MELFLDPLKVMITAFTGERTFSSQQEANDYAERMSATHPEREYVVRATDKPDKYIVHTAKGQMVNRDSSFGSPTPTPTPRNPHSGKEDPFADVDPEKY